ncbi:MAG: phosphoribosylaminoimidazolesuccinocarboxamide synthase [Ilumatobacteraceae bacterium]
MPALDDRSLTLDDIELDLPDRRAGKVRVSYRLSDTERLFVTTDRLSAFDRIITSIPSKGQVLNQLSAWWFDQTRAIVANHLVSVPDPNLTVGRTAIPLPVEVVVRGYITGVTSTSLWQQYADGARTVYGYDLPDGLRKNTQLPTNIITPTTKAHAGAHDEPITMRDVVESGLVDPATWEQVADAALRIFAFGQQAAAAAGLILADTKYEFGLAADTGDLLLIDEVHTPDSSRFWVAGSYEARLADGDEPESLDKEFVRRALIDLGYRGEGAPPTLPAVVVDATSQRYVGAFERITGQRFVPGDQPAAERIARTVAALRGGQPTDPPRQASA